MNPLGLPSLSEKDSTIFSVLFDPESTPSSNASTHQYILIDRNLPPDPHIPTELLTEIRQREVHAVLEAEAAICPPRADHDGNSAYSLNLCMLEHALEMLSKLIEDFPRYASAYNNRAQVRRLLLHCKESPAGEDTHSAQEQHQLVSISPGKKGVATIESDLHHAITLASGGDAHHPFPTTTLERVSPAQAKVLQSAYTQLATLYLAFSRAATGADTGDQYAGDPAMSSERWEERASHYFRLAGRHGSELGRAMAVRTNPYAKMCAGMVKEVMKREVQGAVDVLD